MNHHAGALRWSERLLEPVLGQDDQTWLFDAASEWPSILLNLCDQARYRFWLYERTLDHERYDTDVLRDRLSALARRHRNSDIRFLIHDDRPLVERRHRLIELMRRASSRVQLRLVNADHSLPDYACALIDQCGIAYRRQHDQPAGFANFNAPARVEMLANEFQRLWENARPSLELRHLAL